MRSLIRGAHQPWLYVRDFNEILRPDEKIGGNALKLSQVSNFQKVVDDCQLQDLGYDDFKFT